LNVERLHGSNILKMVTKQKTKLIGQKLDIDDHL
jgi:hypothetical protein